jgi:hypothetical protein
MLSYPFDPLADMMSLVRRLSTFLLICFIGAAFARSSSSVQKHRIAIQGRGERALTTIRALGPSPKKKVTMSPSTVPEEKYPKKMLKSVKKSCKKKGSQPTLGCYQGSSVGLCIINDCTDV